MSDLPKLSEIRLRAEFPSGHPDAVARDAATLVAAVDAVLALHPLERRPVVMVRRPDGTHDVTSWTTTCARCHPAGTYPEPGPCATRRALAEHLDLEG